MMIGQKKEGEKDECRRYRISGKTIIFIICNLCALYHVYDCHEKTQDLRDKKEKNNIGF